jgi:hypothetical protein
MDPAEIHGSTSTTGHSVITPTTEQKLTLNYSGALPRLTPANYSGGAVVGGPASGERLSRYCRRVRAGEGENLSDAGLVLIK